MRFRELLTLLLMVAIALLAGNALATETDETDAPRSGAATATTTEDEEVSTNTEEQTPAPQYGPETTPPDRNQGAFGVGGLFGDTDGTQNRIGEFNVFDGDPLARVQGQAWGNSGSQFYDVGVYFNGNDRDQRYDALLDFNRNVLFEGYFQRMPHRLDNDPLTYLDAGFDTFVVRNTHTAPDAEYGIARSDFHMKAMLAVPGAENVRLTAAFDRIGNAGHDQALTSSKCSNCHIVSKTRNIDQVASDFSLGATVELDSAVLQYMYKHRDFEERAAPPTNTYDDPLHPTSLLPVFGNRISYWSRDGELPFAVVPDHTKESHTVRATVELPSDMRLQAGYAHIRTENENTNVRSIANALKGRFVLPLKPGMTLTAQARWYKIDVDDIFVDIVEPTSPGGPTAGQTYADSYPTFGEADFLRESTRNREPVELEVSWATRLGRTNNVQLTYKFQQLEREYFEVDKTTTNLVRAAWRGRSGRQFRFRVRAEYAWIDDPFAVIHAAGPQLRILTPSPVPFGPGRQYYDMYRSRAWNLSGLPDRAGMLFGMATWSPSGRVSLNAHVRWRDQSNKSLTVSEWNRDTFNPGLELWWAPANQVSVSAGYDYLRDISKTLLSVLAFDG